uniref:Uncharacterized protein n=1 Tax=Neovison vison TaxID=452646 RepID=A0A8C7BTW8_NEOVI
MIACDSLQPPQEVFIQGHLEKRMQICKVSGRSCCSGCKTLPQHIPREKVKKKKKSMTLCQKKAQAQQALPCCLIQEISPKHLS